MIPSTTRQRHLPFHSGQVRHPPHKKVSSVQPKWGSTPYYSSSITEEQHMMHRFIFLATDFTARSCLHCLDMGSQSSETLTWLSAPCKLACCHPSNHGFPTAWILSPDPIIVVNLSCNLSRVCNNLFIVVLFSGEGSAVHKVPTFTYFLLTICAHKLSASVTKLQKAFISIASFNVDSFLRSSPPASFSLHMLSHAV